mmetsp:Transcript_6245/g.13610  ORF Transcript_6245/g.13610 Transcript_6245/m.13610 type:complete len:142 (+) Transcript_6245:42-467(+)
MMFIFSAYTISTINEWIRKDNQDNLPVKYSKTKNFTDDHDLKRIRFFNNTPVSFKRSEATFLATETRKCPTLDCALWSTRGGHSRMTRYLCSLRQVPLYKSNIPVYESKLRCASLLAQRKRNRRKIAEGGGGGSKESNGNA